MSAIVVSDHAQVEGSENGDAVDGEVGGRDEEAGEGGDYDGYEASAGILIGDEWVDEGEGMCEQGDGDDQVDTTSDLGSYCVFFLLKIWVPHVIIKLSIAYSFSLLSKTSEFIETTNHQTPS